MTTVTSETKIRTPAAEDRLESIKRAAVKLFYERGYHATDLRLIAKEVGLHPSSFYNYVSSKEEILYLILRDGIQGMLRGLDEALAGQESAIDQLRAAIRAHAVRVADNRFTSWTNTVELRSLEAEEWRRDIVRLRDQYQRRWMAILERGRDEGLFRDADLHVLLISILTMLSGIARWYNPSGPRSSQEIADELTRFVLHGITDYDGATATA